MITRRANERGFADHGWLRSFHTFSFANYHDPEYMGFHALRVINEDRVAPGMGFGRHSHRDMEIISYVLEGELAHEDSMSTSSVIRAGDVQRMSAGTGVTHSEFNNSPDQMVHFLQIWILPERPGGPPDYEQKAFPISDRLDRWRLVASQDGREGSVRVQQDVNLYAGVFSPGVRVTYHSPAGRYMWLHVARGALAVNGEVLQAGDATALEAPGKIEVVASEEAESLLFDLA